MIETITFGNSQPSLQSYEKKDWLLNETRIVEFFPDCFYKVTLLSIESSNLQNCLNELDVQTPISIDLEWEEEISSFQFAIQGRAIVIRHPKGRGNRLICDFLKSHSFFGKGCHNDKIKLKEKFGEDFEMNLEDIEKTRLRPYDFSLNFVSMTNQFAGKPTAEFKDINITKSNWDLPLLSIRQVLYAAFDVVAIFQAYKNFPPPKQMANQKVPKKVQKKRETKQVNTNLYNHIKKSKLNQNDYKTDGQKIFLKQSKASKIQCFLISDYEGPTDYISVHNILEAIPENTLDYISSFTFNQITSLFISFFVNDVELKSELHFSRLLNIFNNENIVSIPVLDPADSTDNDVLFLSELPIEFHDEEYLSLFLSSFGSDFRFSFDTNFNARVQPHRAQSSLRMKHFIPHIFSGKNKPLLKLSIFPYYLPMVRARLPSFFSKSEDVNSLFSQFGKVEDVSLLTKKTENDVLTAIVTFSKLEEAIQSIEKLNYNRIGPLNEEVYVQRYTDENHMRFLRFHQLIVNRTDDDEKGLRKRFEKYGDLLQVRYDPLFKVFRVIFIEKKSAVLAELNEPDTFMTPLNTMVFIRNLPLTTTDKDIIKLTKPFGKVLGFVFRDFSVHMKGMVVEVIFSSHEEALALKAALHHKKIGKAMIEVNASTLEEVETPIWKMQQRKKWISCTPIISHIIADSKSENIRLSQDNEKGILELESNEDDTHETESNEKDLQNAESSENSIHETESNEKDFQEAESNEDGTHEIESNEKDFQEAESNENDNEFDEEDETESENEIYSVDESAEYNEGLNDNQNQNGQKTNNYSDSSSENINKQNSAANCNHNSCNSTSSEENIQEADLIDVADLVKQCENYGTVIDVKTANSNLKNLSSKVFIMFLDPVSTTKVMRRIKQYNIKMASIGEFVSEIIPEQFNLKKNESRTMESNQPKAVVINNKPSFMNDDCIHEMLFGVKDYDFYVEEDRAIIYTKSKKLAARIANVLNSLKSKNQISMNMVLNVFKRLLSKSTNSNKSTENSKNAESNKSTESSKSTESNKSTESSKSIESNKSTESSKNTESNKNAESIQNEIDSSFFEPNRMSIEILTWFSVPNRPHFHPFERKVSQRKMPIVIDPIPKDTKASEVRLFCSNCGRFDVKVQGSSCEAGKRRAIIQPRNTKAKINCFSIFKNERFKGELVNPVRMSKKEIPPPLEENEDYSSEYD